MEVLVSSYDKHHKHLNLL